MPMTPHELNEEFPVEAERIHALKGANAYFARLVKEYEEVNRAVHNAEARIAPTDEVHEEELRRRRLALKDEIWRLLQAA